MDVVQIIFNNIELNIKKELLQKSKYFNFILENPPKNKQNIIEINNPNLSILGFKYILDILENKTTEYKEKYQKELQYFEIDIPQRDTTPHNHIKIKVNGFSIEVDKNILDNSNFFKSKIERWSTQDKEIIVNQPEISINGFLYVLDLLSGRTEEYREEYEEELIYFGLKYNIEPKYDNMEELFEETNHLNLITTNPSAIEIKSDLQLELNINNNIDEIFNNIGTGDLSVLYHTNNKKYSMGYTSNNFSDNVNFGNMVTANILPSHDAIENFDLQINLPSLPNGYIWRNKLGLKIIKNAILIIGETNIIDLSNQYLEAEYELYTPENMKMKESILDLSLYKRYELSKHPITLIIPLHFIRPNYNNQIEKSKKAIPTIALQHSSISVQINFENIQQLVEPNQYTEKDCFACPTDDKLKEISITNAEILTEGVWLDNYNRQYIAQNEHNVILNQVQEITNSFVDSCPNNRIINFPVNFTNQCKDFIFIIKNETTGDLIDDIDEIRLFINDEERFKLNSQMVKFMYPIKHLGRKIPKGYYYYTFCKNPYIATIGSVLNTGQANIRFEFITKNQINHRITIITTNLNIIRYTEGTGTLLL